MDDLKKSVVGKIKKDNIKPNPRWKFLLRDYVFWAVFGAAVLLGGLAFSVVLFFLLERDWDIYKYLDKSFFEYLFLSIPYFWIIILTAFSGVAYYNWKHTKRGYKFNPYLIVLLSILISLFLGSGLYAAGLGEKMDEVFAENMPCCYESFMERRLNVWSQPEKGLLSGEVVERKNDLLRIEDWGGNEWEVLIDEALMMGSVEMEKGGKLKIVGKKRSENIFEAQQIRPWGHINMKRHESRVHQGKMPRRMMHR